MSTSEHILNNIQNIVILKQEAPASIARATRMLMLPTQLSAVLKQLECGEAIVRLADFPDPVKGKVSFVEPHRGSISEATAALLAVPSKRLAELPQLQAELRTSQGELGRAKKSAVESPGQLRRHVHDVIAEWVKQPGMPLVRIWEALSVKHAGTRDAIREALSPKFADLRDERFGSTKVAILEPTEAGYELVGRRVPEGRGRGGVVHRNGAWWARDWALMQGYEAKLEWCAPGASRHPVDVGFLMNGKWHVIEIVSTVIDNLADAIRASLLGCNVIETVTIVTTTKSMHADIRRRLAAATDLAPVMCRVQYSTFDFYLREVHG